MSWSEKVMNLMQEQGINQKQLSMITGIAESSLSRYLRSEQSPRLDIVVNIAKSLHVETTFLLDEKDRAESAYNTISTAVARYGNELTAEEKSKLVVLILGGTS